MKENDLIHCLWEASEIEGFGRRNLEYKCVGWQFEPPCDKTNKMIVRPAKTRISPVWSVFAVRSMGSWGPQLSSYGLYYHENPKNVTQEKTAVIILVLIFFFFFTID